MIGNPLKIIQWLYNQEHDKVFTIKEYKEKRSLSQNAYAWKLITEMGNVLRKSKEEVYLQMLEDYGQSEIVSIVSSVNPVGFFKYYKEIGTGTINNKEFTHYKIFKGSSEFDTKEMTIFIDGIIQECKNIGGIETLTPDEIAKMNLN
jgi:hypothetical protein